MKDHPFQSKMRSVAFRWCIYTWVNTSLPLKSKYQTAVDGNGSPTPCSRIGPIINHAGNTPCFREGTTALGPLQLDLEEEM